MGRVCAWGPVFGWRAGAEEGWNRELDLGSGYGGALTGCIKDVLLHRSLLLLLAASLTPSPTYPSCSLQARDQVLTEVAKRRSQQPQQPAPGAGKQGSKQQSAAGPDGGPPQTGASGGGADLRAMVAKLKRKAEVQQDKDRAQALGKGAGKKAKL